MEIRQSSNNNNNNNCNGNGNGNDNDNNLTIITITTLFTVGKTTVCADKPVALKFYNYYKKKYKFKYT